MQGAWHERGNVVAGMKYKARVEYRAVIAVIVEAESMKEAEDKAIEEADDGLSGNVSVYSIDIEPA